VLVNEDKLGVPPPAAPHSAVRELRPQHIFGPVELLSMVQDFDRHDEHIGREILVIASG
jgi:hypothetical protein